MCVVISSEPPLRDLVARVASPAAVSAIGLCNQQFHVFSAINLMFFSIHPLHADCTSLLFSRTGCLVRAGESFMVFSAVWMMCQFWDVTALLCFWFPDVLRRCSALISRVLAYTSSSSSKLRRKVNRLITYLLHGAESFLSR